MKASLLPHYSSPDDLRLTNIGEQESSEVQIHAADAPVSPADTLMRKDKFSPSSHPGKVHLKQFRRTGHRFRTAAQT